MAISIPYIFSNIFGSSPWLVERSVRYNLRALLSDREAEQDRQGAKGKGIKQDIRLIAQTPIIVTLDGKEITRVVNKRIFEASDALI